MSDMSGQPVPQEDLPPEAQAQSGQPVPIEDLPQEAQSGHPVPPEDMPQGLGAPTKDYGTSGQQALAGLEGAAQGVAGPLAPYIETKMGVPPEDIQGRAEANPVTHHGMEAAAFAGSMMTGVGEAGLIAKALPEMKVLADAGELGKIGAKALKGGMEMAAMQGGDEVSKRIIDQPDPNETAVSALVNMGYAGLLGAVTGGMFGTIEAGANAGMKALDNQKLAKRAQSFLSGFGASHANQDTEALSKFIEPGMEDLDRASFKAGAKFQQNMPEVLSKMAIDRATEAAGAAAGAKAFGITGSIPGYHLAKQLVEPWMEKILQKPMTSATQKYAVPYMTKLLTSDAAKAVPSAIDYATKSARGAQKLLSSVDMLFKPGGQQLLESGIDEIKKNKIDQGIQDSILDKQISNENVQSSQVPGYAHGGKVMSQDSDHFAKHFPTENTLIQSARSRVYNHLQTLKPKPQPGALAFDNNSPTNEQHRAYDKALDLATNPLHILGHIKNGTLTSEHIQNMNAMWPEINQALHKKITEKISEQQLKGEKPSYKLRQGFSVLLGTPLESVMSPMGIQAAQSVFAPKAPQTPQNGPKLKKDTAKLGSKTNKMYNTVSQEAETDRSARD